MPKTLQISQTLREWMDAFMHRSMRGWARFAKSTGLSMAQFSVLMQLYHKGACGMSQISERFDVTPAAASQLVEKLVQAGYIERAEDPSDRRAKLLKLSPAGTKLLEEGVSERYRWLDDLVRSLSEEEQVKVGEALEILTRAAQKMES
ncbi:MAG: MarR family winged helix-turn-helix transcriptional regulator [Chloroflexota bacterium]|nr:MarR family transcriptional regulator [Chloroflexota bacterium]MBI5703059.1 MarR family transcriptional regulator [Chloroflexota bacterium]